MQRNVAREVDQALTDIDAADLARINRALDALADGSYSLCDECGCDIPFARLQIEPQTQHTASPANHGSRPPATPTPATEPGAKSALISAHLARRW